MGIPVGKLSLYTACAGVPPHQTLPITLDMGTNTKAILDNPNYIGLKQPRLQGKEFDEVMEEFVRAVQYCFPKALIQWEDFGNANAFRVLETYRETVCSFNDDIQGTACVVLGGLISAIGLTKKPLKDHTFLFLGAGEAGVGIGDLIAYYLVKEEGLPSLEEARRKIYFVDSKGLVCQSRVNLPHHKQRYAHDVPAVRTLEEAVDSLKPTALIGVSAQAATFTQSVIEKMNQINKQPIVFALSNPTHKAECTAEEAYKYSKGQAIFASGSPFDPVHFNGQTYVPGQGNNAYVFPGIGMGAIVSEARTIPDDIFLVAAKALASQVAEEELEQGLVYPPIESFRDVSFQIAEAVADYAFSTGIARRERPAHVGALVRTYFYRPAYKNLAKL
jgi:malate dehydrogenase (oxaloacetate-decarboxylating)(NADP+)